MILYFSGTGNSAHAAEIIARETGDEILNLFDRIRGQDHSPLESQRPWVIVTPTYAWRIPRVAEELLRRTELRGSREVYFAMTCGSEIGAAARYARRLAASLGLNYRGCAEIVMPENYIALFDAPDADAARRLVKRADEALLPVARAVLDGLPLPEKPAKLADRLRSGPVNPAFYVLIVRDKKFRSTDACVGCGLCEKRCPLGNVKIDAGRPVWNGNCTHCMACICSCPRGAIEYGRASVGKHRYTCPE